MSGGSQHNPNGRQSQLGPGWSPLQVANFLARAPQVHMAPDRGVTWHTPTPPSHLYHVPAPSPPDPLQAMKNAGANSVFRHTATPPELYRHTPTPPDKHLMRHTPSPGDMKASAAMPPGDMYPHLGAARDKLVRAEELLAYARVGVDLSLSSSRSANGSVPSPAPSGGSGGGGGGGGGGHPSPALSVRDAPTINSLIARAAPRHPHTRVDALLERLGPAPAPAPVSPHSVIVHSRAAPTPSPPSSNEDSADSCGAPPGSKRKRKPERVVRVPSAPPPPAPSEPPRPVAPPLPPHPPIQPTPPPLILPTPPPRDKTPTPAPVIVPLENGDVIHAKLNGPEQQQPPSPVPHSRRKTRSGSAETIADIAAMIADTGPQQPTPQPAPATVPPPLDAATAVATLESVLASPEPVVEAAEPASVKCSMSPTKDDQAPEAVTAPQAAAPRRRSARASNSEATNVPVESPSEAKPAEPEASEARSAEPTAASFVEVENQLEKMFAGLEEEPSNADANDCPVPQARKRRRSAPARGDRSGRGRDDRRKAQRKKDVVRARKMPKESVVKDAYDSGSNASSSRSRGPYIQIRGARDSPVSVAVMNSWTGEEEVEGVRRKAEDFGAGRRARGLHASTLGLRYDATTPDATWLCAFCHTGPHAHALGDLFGPYTLDTDCEEFRSLDEATRRRYTTENPASPTHEVWFHEACAVWAPGLVAAGARVWGLAGAVWGARGARCGACGGAGAALACSARGCRARTHLPCASVGEPAARWTLQDATLAATCPRHSHAQAPAPAHAHA